MKKIFKILVVNPGSTSTKLSLFEDDLEKHGSQISHSLNDLSAFSSVPGQRDFRWNLIEAEMRNWHEDLQTIDAAVGRGGLLRPVESGVFAVNDAMCGDLSAGRYGEHASNLGALLALRAAEAAGVPAYIADPVVVDELDPAARYSGMPEIQRKSIFHALNQKAAARKTADEIGKRYEECNFIVAHLGGGITVGAHKQGRVVDVNNGLDGDGPFTPERSGGLPAGQLVSLVLHGGLSEAEIRKKIKGRGGLSAYCGSNNLEDLMIRASKGDKEIQEVVDAMSYQISKEIAMHGATLCGRVDRIIITGGMAHDTGFVSKIAERTAFLAPVTVIPGEMEMYALAERALQALTGRTEVKEY